MLYLVFNLNIFTVGMNYLHQQKIFILLHSVLLTSDRIAKVLNRPVNCKLTCFYSTLTYSIGV